MQFKKLIALLTVGCFFESFVAAPFLQALSTPQPNVVQFKAAIDQLIIPSTIGRITNGNYFGSDTVVVNVQDLHCNPEVQRNISSILGNLDEKYHLEKVFLEGGYGDIDVSWLGKITAPGTVKKNIADILVDQGRLTGTEYYAFNNKRPALLKGIEDEQIHKANIQRLGKILNRKPFYEEKVKLLDKDLAFLEAKYFTVRNRKFNQIVERYRLGKMPANRFYKLLGKYVETVNSNPDVFNNPFTIAMGNYPNMQGYLELQKLNKELDYKRISRQLQVFVGLLKDKLPYSAYNYLLEKTGNFSQMDKLYVTLSLMTKEYNISLQKNFPDLRKFLDYVDKGQTVNPIELIKEEKKLIEEIRIAFSSDVSELEVSFAVDFYQYFKDYLFNQLAADDYAYFNEQVGKFKKIWGKYTYVDHLKAFEPDFSLLNEYYKVNADRNQVFLKNMLPAGEQLGKHPTLQSGGREDNIRQTVKCLDTASNVIVVVAGGFHTQGLEKILDDRKISYVSITPNITHDATASSAVYQHLLILQAMGLSVVSNRPANTLSALSAFLKQKINSVQMFARSVVNVDFKHSDALGLTITSSQPGMGQFRALAGAAMEKAVGATKIDIADLLAQLKAIDTEMGRNDQFAIENNRIVATIDGQQIRINANGTFADDTIVTDAPAGTSVATKINGEKIAVAAQSLAAWSFNQPAAVQSLLPGMLAVLLWMAEQNMLNDASEGAIYELNAEALESIAGENATNPETIAQMPEVVQKAMLAMHENTSIKGAQDNSVLQAMNTAVAMIQKSKKLSVADRRSQKGTSDIPILSNDNVEQVLAVSPNNAGRSAMLELPGREALLLRLFPRLPAPNNLRAQGVPAVWINMYVGLVEVFNVFDPAFVSRHPDRGMRRLQYIGQGFIVVATLGVSWLVLGALHGTDILSMHGIISLAIGLLGGAIVHGIWDTAVPPAAQLILGDNGWQTDILHKLMQDKGFSREMAAWLDGGYNRGLNKPAEPFLSPAQEKALEGDAGLMPDGTQPQSDIDKQSVARTRKSAEEKIAISLAGFYGLESGIGYISERDHRTPLDILAAIKNKTLRDRDMLLISRFANATWKAGQPFRSFGRIERDTFRPGTLLVDAELEKDFQQIRDAAEKLFNRFQQELSRETGVAVGANLQKELVHNSVQAYGLRLFDILQQNENKFLTAHAPAAEQRAHLEDEEMLRGIASVIGALHLTAGYVPKPGDAAPGASSALSVAQQQEVLRIRGYENFVWDMEARLNTVFDKATTARIMKYLTFVPHVYGVYLWGYQSHEAGYDSALQSNPRAKSEMITGRMPLRIEDYSRQRQFDILHRLMKDKGFSREMAAWLDGGYNRELNKPAEPFLSPAQEKALEGDAGLMPDGTQPQSDTDKQLVARTRKSAEEKIAISLAGFYALESGIGVLCERDDERTPLDVLIAIANKTLPAQDMLFIERFANATWKAGQPFRSLARIERDTFRPATILTPEELNKDRQQVIDAAVKLREAIEAGLIANREKELGIDLDAEAERTYLAEKETRDYLIRLLEVMSILEEDLENQKTRFSQKKMHIGDTELIQSIARNVISRYPAAYNNKSGRLPTKMEAAFIRNSALSLPNYIFDMRTRLNLIFDKETVEALMSYLFIDFHSYYIDGHRVLVPDVAYWFYNGPGTNDRGFTGVVADLPDSLDVQIQCAREILAIYKLDRPGALASVQEKTYPQDKEALIKWALNPMNLPQYDPVTRIRAIQRFLTITHSKKQGDDVYGIVYVDWHESDDAPLNSSNTEGTIDISGQSIPIDDWTAQGVARAISTYVRDINRDQMSKELSASFSKADVNRILDYLSFNYIPGEDRYNGTWFVGSEQNWTVGYYLGAISMYGIKMVKTALTRYLESLNRQYQVVRDLKKISRERALAVATEIVKKENEIGTISPTREVAMSPEEARLIAVNRISSMPSYLITYSSDEVMAALLFITLVSEKGSGIFQGTTVYRLAVDNKASKDADEKSAAVSPNNAGRYLQRSLQGVPQRLGLAGVHWSEFFPMMFTPRAFDLGHGEANAARTAAIWTMFTVGWVTTIAAGLALGAWLLPLSLGFAPLVIGLAGVAAFITTGIFHVGYDMQAAIPTAFFVTENAGYLKNDPKINTALGYQPIIITRADALTFSRTLANKTLHNTGIRQNGEPVWTALENGVLTVYVSGKGAAFAQNAAEVISQLKGYANIRGSSRAVRVLSAAKGAAVNTVKPIVFDYTQNAQLYNADSIPVRTGDSIAAGYEEIINTHNAEMYAVRPEIGIKTVWSKDFLEHKEMPFNQSLVLSKDAIIEAGVDGIRALQKRGAKIYMLYESPDQNDAVTIAKKYGLNGIIYPNILAGQVEKSKNPEMWVAGLGAPTDKGVRPFQELNLNDAAVARAAIKKVPSGAVVKVTVDDKHMDALTMLNELPYDVLLLIDGEVFREAARQPNRDISQIKLFGVNILQLLHLTPTTSADKRSYERKVAFGLTIEDYKKPDQATLGQELANIVNGKLDAIENNTRFFNAVRLHRANAADPQEFLKAVAARYLLASQGKMYGLMSDDLERVFVENMREMTPAQLTTVVAQFEEANAMINTEQSGAQVNADLMVHIQKPITAGLRIALIALFADARFTGVVDKASMHQNDARLTRSILEAA